MADTECRACLEPLPPQKAGQRRRYCDEECRRHAEMELRYVRSRIKRNRESVAVLEERIARDQETVAWMVRK